MKINDVIIEGGNSNATRFNSEVGLLFGLIGKGEFDYDRPEKSIPYSNLINPEKTYYDIKKYLSPYYDYDIFQKWIDRSSNIKKHILSKQAFPNKFGWVAANNSDEGQDIQFDGSITSGIALKGGESESGSPTLKNPSFRNLGLSPEKDSDLLYSYAKPEFLEFKKRIIEIVLSETKKLNGKMLYSQSKSTKYYSQYKGKKNGSDIFFVQSERSSKEGSYEEFLKDLHRVMEYQRVFGYWATQNWSTISNLAEPLYLKIGKTFEKIIEEHLKKNMDKLHFSFGIGNTPYYFVNPSSVWYIPSSSEIVDLKIKKLTYDHSINNSSIKLNIVLGRESSEDNATAIIYVRYGQGMFGIQPITPIQNLQNYQHLGWEFLGKV